MSLDGLLEERCSTGGDDLLCLLQGCYESNELATSFLIFLPLCISLLGDGRDAIAVSLFLTVLVLTLLLLVEELLLLERNLLLIVGTFVGRPVENLLGRLLLGLAIRLPALEIGLNGFALIVSIGEHAAQGGGDIVDLSSGVEFQLNSLEDGFAVFLLRELSNC